jgi:hypothetical protein
MSLAVFILLTIIPLALDIPIATSPTQVFVKVPTVSRLPDVPPICNLLIGLVVPIPTLPLFET